MSEQSNTEQEPSREQLLAQAAELDIDGRTKMKVKDLQEAIDEKLAGPPIPAADPTEPTIERDRLIAESQAVVGQPSHVLAGALADIDGTGPVTVAQAQVACDVFLNRAVREDA